MLHAAEEKPKQRHRRLTVNS